AVPLATDKTEKKRQPEQGALGCSQHSSEDEETPPGAQPSLVEADNTELAWRGRHTWRRRRGFGTRARLPVPHARGTHYRVQKIGVRETLTDRGRWKESREHLQFVTCEF